MDDVPKIWVIALIVGICALFFVSRGVDATMERGVAAMLEPIVEAQKVRDAEQDEKLDTILFVLEQILEGKLTND